MKNKVVICIGSNFDADINIEKAKAVLERELGPITFADQTESKAVNWSKPCIFTNQVGYFESDKEFDYIKQLTKQIERDLGRNAEQRALGNMPMDIDIVIWNDAILKPDDLKQTYVHDAIRSLELSLNQTILQ